MTSGSVIPLDLPYCMKEGAWDGVMVHIFFLRGNCSTVEKNTLSMVGQPHFHTALFFLSTDLEDFSLRRLWCQSRGRCKRGHVDDHATRILRLATEHLATNTAKRTSIAAGDLLRDAGLRFSRHCGRVV